jgi:transcription antitermination factor NusG
LKNLDWYIIELSEFGETATYPEIVAAIESVFGEKSEYFIPIHHEQMGSYVSTNTLFEGYVFIKDSDSVKKCLMNIKENRIFAGLLKTCGKIRMLDSYVIGGLKRKLKNSLNKKFQSGVKVKIHEGVFQNLEGEIQSMEEDGRIANIRVVCLSRVVIAPIPTTCIEEIK